MRRFLQITSFFAFSALVAISCIKEDDVIDCNWQNIEVVTRTYGDSLDSTITIYPVITTNNYDFCDSMVFSPDLNDWIKPDGKDGNPGRTCTQQEAIDSIQAGNYTACPCRENPDKQNDQINSKLVIEGIENFPNNILYIKVPGDTVKIRTYQNYDNNNNVFQGYVPTDTSLGYYEFYSSRILASGSYDYELVLYKDVDHTVPFDTIANSFIIITSRYKDKNINCGQYALEQDDPLLQ